MLPQELDCTERGCPGQKGGYLLRCCDVHRVPQSQLTCMGTSFTRNTHPLGSPSVPGHRATVGSYGGYLLGCCDVDRVAQPQLSRAPVPGDKSREWSQSKSGTSFNSSNIGKHVELICRAAPGHEGAVSDPQPQLSRAPVPSLVFGVWGLGFGIWSLGFGVWGCGLRVWLMNGALFGVSTLGLQCMMCPRQLTRPPVYSEIRLMFALGSTLRVEG